MPTCKSCGDRFPTWIKIDGKQRCLNNRKFCLKCSPFGRHNTSPTLHVGCEKLCNKCGEKDPSKFYGNKRHICGKCHAKYTTERGKRKKQFVCEKLGGKCVSCGYDKYVGSLDIHHKDPAKKDSNFRSKRGWSEERILKEIENCILLCRNCHAAFHAGELAIGV
jgi:hypothetical protein